MWRRLLTQQKMLLVLPKTRLAPPRTLQLPLPALQLLPLALQPPLPARQMLRRALLTLPRTLRVLQKIKWVTPKTRPWKWARPPLPVPPLAQKKVAWQVLPLVPRLAPWMR
jgi:hypothetical protein